MTEERGKKEARQKRGKDEREKSPKLDRQKQVGKLKHIHESMSKTWKKENNY